LPVGKSDRQSASVEMEIFMFFKVLRDDIKSIKERDPAARSSAEVFLLYSGFKALLSYRFSHWLHKRKLFFLARYISQRSRKKTGIEIHPGAEIGKALFIDHGMGVVIGETVEIGDNCTIYQGVTLGGTGKHKGKRHPTIGNNVMIGAGAKVLGPLRVGDNCKIAAGAVVLCELPPNSTAVGVPARVVSRDGVKLPKFSDLDQIHMPDPMTQQICALEARLKHLEEQIENSNK